MATAASAWATFAGPGATFPLPQPIPANAGVGLYVKARGTVFVSLCTLVYFLFLYVNTQYCGMFSLCTRSLFPPSKCLEISWSLERCEAVYSRVLAAHCWTNIVSLLLGVLYFWYRLSVSFSLDSAC